jgi:dTDP-4-dehydrorhamnose 3,5-epimerase
MKFLETPLPGTLIVEVEKLHDERGFFGRSFCTEEFRAAGIPLEVAQCNVSFNKLRGTLRGMHFQIAPHEEAKLVRCTRGAIHDVVVDLRPGSATYGRHFAVELTEDNHRALYIPPGLAHGFQTLADESEVFYLMSTPFVPGAARGLRWNDPRLGIQWPLVPTVISQKDQSYEDFAG